MNNIDEKLIEALSKDARTPFGTIAKNLGVSTQTISRRYNELKKNGIIQHCGIALDLTKIGYKGSAHLMIITKPESSITKTIRHLSKTQNIVTATQTMGEYEGYAVLLFKNISDLYDRLVQIRTMPNVLKVDISFRNPSSLYFPPQDRVITSEKMHRETKKVPEI